MIKEVTYYDVVCDRCGKSLIEENDICCQEPFDAVFFCNNAMQLCKYKGKALLSRLLFIRREN